MRYRNTTKTPSYCAHARRTLGPGEWSQELPDLLDALGSLLRSDRSLGLRLTDAELSAMQELLDRHVRTVGFDPETIRDALDDPDGLKAAAVKAAAERSERMKAYRDYVREDKAFEAMVHGETTKEKVEAARNAGRIDVASMQVKIGDKPKNIREAMALNAKMDLARKMGEAGNGQA